MNKTGLPCPSPNCNSSDAFNYDTDKQVGNCFSCGEPYPAKGTRYSEEILQQYPLKERRMNNQVLDSNKNLEEVFTGFRSITKKTAEKYGVYTTVDAKGDEVERKYPYPSGQIKTRTLPKSFHSNYGFKPEELFGMNLFTPGSSKFVTITEGEEDALSVYQMMGDYPVVSLPNSTPSKNLFAGPAKDWLNSFDKIVLAIEADAAGDRISDKFAQLFPNKVYRVPMDQHKDANEYLVKGADKVFYKSWWAMQKYVPENVWNTPDQFLKIFREDEDSTYLPTGIQDLDDVVLGLMRGHLTVFQAPEGVGKTELMRMLEYNIIKNYPDVPIAICHIEETKKRSMLGLVSYKLDTNVTRKDLIEEKGLTKDVEAAIISLSEGENLYQFAIGVDDDPEEILDKIRFFSQACGCAYVFFEPIQDLAYSRKSEDSVEGFLSSLATKLSRLASELNVGIVTIAHENDDGAIRDCRMIGKRASVVIKLERDKMADDEATRNTTNLLVLKNRPAGTTGFGGHLKFHPDSFTLKAQYE
jgi:twinkle protein